MSEIRTVQLLLFFKENKGSFAKVLKIEQKVFAVARTDSLMEAMSRRNYILLEIKIQKMNDALAFLSSNYDFEGPTSYHDQPVITQLFNDLEISLKKQ